MKHTVHTESEAHLHRNGARGHLSPKIHSHHALHVGLHDRNHRKALLLLRLLLLHGYHSCQDTHKHSYGLLWILGGIQLSET